MSILNNSRLSPVFILAAILLSGCINEQKPEEKVYDVLEKVVEKEKDFEKRQEPLVKLETREKQLYDKIINLGMKDFEEIKKLSDEASAIVVRRKEHMEKEQKSILASKKEFESLSPVIEEIESQKLKDRAKELQEIMMDRYKIHDTLYQDYSNAPQLDKELYAMFKKEDLTLDQLENQISKINEMYEKILSSNKQFNEKTKEYNEAKLDFYKEAGLEINTKE